MARAAAPARPDPNGEGPDAHGGVLTVDLGAIARNYQRLAAEADGARTAAVVKADAYGLGADRIAPALHAAGCRTFFVAHVEEGRRLRTHLPPDADILVLHGAPPGTEAICLAHRLTPVLNGWEQFRGWVRSDELGGCVLQFDTGMARFGFPLGEAGNVRAALDAAPRLRATLVMSHLACADAPDNAENGTQLARLVGLRPLFPEAAFSLAASSGIYLGRAFHLDLVRPGAALYGVPPVREGPNPMEPVVRLQGRVMQVRDVPAGAGIGYGHTAHAEGPTRLATVAVGYADGVLRAASNRASAWLGDRRLPFVGRVSMDSVILDVTGVPAGSVRPGILVDLLDRSYGVDHLAADSGTIGYEILTGIGHRYRRDYRADPNGGHRFPNNRDARTTTRRVG